MDYNGQEIVSGVDVKASMPQLQFAVSWLRKRGRFNFGLPRFPYHFCRIQFIHCWDKTFINVLLVEYRLTDPFATDEYSLIIKDQIRPYKLHLYSIHCLCSSLLAPILFFLGLTLSVRRKTDAKAIGRRTMCSLPDQHFVQSNASYLSVRTGVTVSQRKFTRIQAVYDFKGDERP